VYVFHGHRWNGKWWMWSYLTCNRSFTTTKCILNTMWLISCRIRDILLTIKTIIYKGISYWMSEDGMNCLPLASTWVHTRVFWWGPCYSFSVLWFCLFSLRSVYCASHCQWKWWGSCWSLCFNMCLYVLSFVL